MGRAAGGRQPAAMTPPVYEYVHTYIVIVTHVCYRTRGANPYQYTSTSSALHILTIRGTREAGECIMKVRER